MNKRVLLTVAAVTVVGSGALTATNAFAADTTNTSSPVSSLVQKIADTFHLNKDDVQKVFDQNHQEQQAKRETRFENKLSQDVSNGKLTEQQKQLIIQKRKDLENQMQTNKDNAQNLSQEQRKTQRQQMKSDLENWAKQNNIDLKYLMPFGGRGMGRHGFGSFDHGTQPTATPTPAQ